MPADPTTFVAEIVQGNEGLAAVNPFANPRPDPVPLVVGAGELGDYAIVQRTQEAAEIKRLLAPAGSARASLYRLLAERGIDPEHPSDVMSETSHWLRRTGVDDPSLVDLTALPFVTIDGAGTRDLDQAVCIRPQGAEYMVRYALADASYYVRPGSALFREALRRGASYYLPGLSVPMLPRSLCEGLISLNPGVDRRATVFEMLVDGRGIVVRTEVVRARIHSRGRLTFDRVEALLDGRGDGKADGRGGKVDAEVLESLRLLERVGELRLRDAAQRDVIPHRTAETRIKLSDGRGLDFVAIERMRNRVERYGEQLSLMCNTEGATLLRNSADENIQPIYRTHAPPAEDRLEDLAATVEGLVQAWDLGSAWRWDRQRQSLGEYLRGLPDEPDLHPVREAIARQALLVNVRSTFTSEPGPHFGIGADVYARFSAPMREIVGIFVHGELWELLGEAHKGPESDESLRQVVIDAANRSRQVQRDLTREANRLALDRLFERELETPASERPIRSGTVMGLGDNRVYIRLHDPPIDVKIYADTLGEGAQIDPRGVEVSREGQTLCRMGQMVSVRLTSRDRTRNRWILELM